jgi:hypothetical protein
MNEMEGSNTTTSNANTTTTTANTISSNINNLNKLESKNPTSKQAQPVQPVQPVESAEEDITDAIKKLNDTMNEDINNTVKADSTEVQSGGRRKGFQEQQLTKKIKLLRLKLTKNKLENEVKKHTKHQLHQSHQNTNNNKRKNKSKHTRRNKAPYIKALTGFRK